MIVIIAPEAAADLLEIADAIAIDNPARARSFARELEEKALHLAELPRGFPVVPELSHLEIRRRNHGRYVIFYVANADQVDVLRFVYAARDLEALFANS